MIKQKDKTTSRLSRKRGITNNVIKPRPLSDGEFLDGEIKPEIHTKSESSDGFSTLDIACENYYDTCWEEHQHLEMTPRNAAKETSKKVQNFIKQVSNVIENKNPFEEKVKYSYGRLQENVNPAVFDSNEFNRMDMKTESQNDEVSRIKNLSKIIETEKSKRKHSDVKACSKKNSEKSSPNKKSKHRSSSKKREYSDKRNQKESSLNARKLGESKCTRNPSDFKNRQENEKQNVKTCSQEANERPTFRSNQAKKRKRSEIPLRKNRTDASKNPTPLSFLLQNPLKQVESIFSVDLCSKKKPFSPIDELSLCSELQITIHAVGSSENFSDSGKTTDNESTQNSTFIYESIKLDRCLKSSNIPDFRNPSSDELTDERPSREKKTNAVDLSNVKSSSFTVLRTNTTVLNKLESLHKRSVSTKENPCYGKKIARNSSRPRVISSKPSFSSLKGKGSKKHLSTRLSSKGNKPGLKVKGRKIKNVAEENLLLPKVNSPDKNKAQLETCKQIVSKNGNVKAENQKTENLKNETTGKESRRGGKSSPSTTGSSKVKEELKASPRGKHTTTKLEYEESKKLSKLISSRNPTFIKKSFLENITSGEGEKLKSDKGDPITPPPTPATSQSVSIVSDVECRQVEEDEKSSKTVTFDDSINSKNSSRGSSEPEGSQPTKAVEKPKHSLEESAEIEGKNSDLIIRGKSLSFAKDEPPEKPKSLNSDKVEKWTNIVQKNDVECISAESKKVTESMDWLFMSRQKCEELAHNMADSRNSENEEVKKEINTNNLYTSADSFSSDLTDEQLISEPFVSDLRKPRKSCSTVKKPQRKTSVKNVKGIKKKKIRSDAGDRRFPCNSFFKSHASLQSKIKADTKLRSTLTKSSNREEKRDAFEDTAAVKLRRRNSEPHSLREYSWKPPDFVIPRSHKPSVSSVASSLRHLNTDEIDDFVFWEPVPQKITSCWETSLYHFKKAWTVLSCSVFRDNRQSKTPGLILENLRNGGNLNPRLSRASQNEVSNYHKQNLFDVEPSIAQKNIDIRNWLAALNFPTPPSTSNDIFSEGNFTMQSTIDAENLKKTQANAKRRKVLPNIKFSDESTEKTHEEQEKFKASTKWRTNEADGLMELIQRGSGGFVTKEKFMDSEYSIGQPNVFVNLCVYSKSAEEKNTPVQTEDKNTESQALKSLEPLPQTSELVSIETISHVSPDHSTENSAVKEELPGVEEEDEKKEKFSFRRLLKGNMSPFFSEVNIWKYLFLLTLFIVILHFCYLSSSLCRNQ